MRYILINPVTESMYSEIVLNDFLTRHGYIKVSCETDWSKIVIKKYEKLLKNSKGTVIDMRCPMAYEMFINEKDTEGLIFHDTEPILIHCAREISLRKELNGYEKLIITPCKSLADMGNSLGLNETVFITWLDFLHTLGSDLPYEIIQSTPIPLGYFKDIKVEQFGVSGERKIKNFLHNKEWKKLRLIELLFCNEGCHNGDGVIRYD